MVWSLEGSWLSTSAISTVASIYLKRTFRCDIPSIYQATPHHNWLSISSPCSTISQYNCACWFALIHVDATNWACIYAIRNHTLVVCYYRYIIIVYTSQHNPTYLKTNNKNLFITQLGNAAFLWPKSPILSYNFLLPTEYYRHYGLRF